MRFFLSILLLLLLWPSAAPACFGPKLSLGVESDTRSELLFELVALYVKEKTGVETLRVPLNGRDPARELQEERLDLALVQGKPIEPLLLQIPGWPSLAAGPRPLTDLQFSTVPAALRKLNGQLTPAHLQSLHKQVEAGESAAAAVRAFLTAKRWI